jgi:membrane protein implicated in regulation of membrane protease activity
MNAFKTALRELLGLFVDDGAFALAILAWCAAAAAVLPRLPLAPVSKGVTLFVGLAVILVESAWRRSRR